MLNEEESNLINLKKYNPLFYVDVFEKIFNLYNPRLVCFGHTYETRDWVPRLSARLNIPLISDCIEINNNNNTIECIRPVYQAKLNEKIHLTSNSIVSFQAGSYSKDDIKKGDSPIEEINIELTNSNSSIRLGHPVASTVLVKIISIPKLVGLPAVIFFTVSA